MSTTLSTVERAEDLLRNLPQRRAESAAQYRRTRSYVPPAPKTKRKPKHAPITGRSLALANFKANRHRHPRMTPASLRAFGQASLAISQRPLPAENPMPCFGADGWAFAAAVAAHAATERLEASR